MDGKNAQQGNGPFAGRRRLRVFGGLAVAVAVVELLLCFQGPIAFKKKPSLVLFPPFSAGLTENEVSRLAAFAERQIARLRSYEIVSYSFVEEYFVRTDPDAAQSRRRPADYQQAQKLAQELELDRYAIAWAYRSQGRCELSISIRDTADGTVLRSGSFVSLRIEDLLRGVGKDGKDLDFRESLAADTRGLSFTDLLVLALLGLQLLAGLLALLGREPGVLVEVVWAPALILFVFAYIFALSANMDYVQRYIASGGQLRLAESTAGERLHAALRFGPMLLLNGFYYVWRALAARGAAGAGAAARRRHWLRRYVGSFPLPWVVLSAALFGFSFPSAISLEGLGWLGWICLVPLLLVLLTVKPGMGIFYGVTFGALQAMIVNYWLGTYDYVTLHLVTIAFAAQYLLFMAALVWLIKAGGRWGFLSVPAAWLLYDYCRSIGVLGYPWGLLGVTQYRFLPLMQIASLGGVWAVDFVVLLANAALAWTLAAPEMGWTWSTGFQPATDSSRRTTAWPRMISGAVSMLPLTTFAAVLAFSVASGTVILSSLRSRLYGRADTPKITVLLLQQNTDPRKQKYEENTKRLMALTDQALASLPRKPDLIAWPEGGFRLDITYWGDPQRADSDWGRQVRWFRDYQKNLSTWLATGTQDHEWQILPDGETSRKDYNSSVLLDAQGEINGFYHKMHLVPFSEYFPLDKRRFAGLYGVFQKYDISDWDIGTERVVFQHEKMRFLTPLCFEDVFPDDVRRFVLKDVDLILNMSNDYWSLSPVEGRQHGLNALFRAVENQRPLLRATSSGCTVYIDATGRIQPGSPAPYTAGYTFASVPLPEKRLTLYTRCGDWFPLACAAGLLVFGLLSGLLSLVRKGERRIRSSIFLNLIS
jgi:apolipoprotein N-acyltransferase